MGAALIGRAEGFGIGIGEVEAEAPFLPFEVPDGPATSPGLGAPFCGK